MTNEEALNIVRAAIKAFAVKQTDDNEEFVEYIKERHDLELMLAALEKQKPRKPTEKEHIVAPSEFRIEKLTKSNRLTVGTCPICRETVNSDMGFCSECGQSLLWENEEEIE